MVLSEMMRQRNAEDKSSRDAALEVTKRRRSSERIRDNKAGNRQSVRHQGTSKEHADSPAHEPAKHGESAKQGDETASDESDDENEAEVQISPHSVPQPDVEWKIGNQSLQASILPSVLCKDRNPAKLPLAGGNGLFLRATTNIAISVGTVIGTLHLPKSRLLSSQPADNGAAVAPTVDQNQDQQFLLLLNSESTDGGNFYYAPIPFGCDIHAVNNATSLKVLSEYNLTTVVLPVQYEYTAQESGAWLMSIIAAKDFKLAKGTWTEAVALHE